MTDLANLVVTLEANISKYTEGLQNASNQIQKFGTQVGESISSIAKNFAALYALKEVFDFGESIVQSAAKLDILSHAVGIAADQLSQLAYAAKLEGVDDISVPLERMARSAGSVAEGNEKAAAAFRALGVDVKNTDGTLKDSQKLLLDVADAVASYRDGIGKTRVVQEIFGRSSADFIAFLDQGAAKIREMQQEAIDLGVAISTSTAQAAHEVEQNVERMQAAFHGVFNRALEELLPTFEKLSDSMVAFAKDGSNTREVVDEIVFAIKTLTLLLVQASFIVHGLGDSIGYIIAQGKLLITLFGDLARATVDPLGALDDFKTTLGQIAAIDADEKARSEQALKNYRETRRLILHQVTQDELDAFKAQRAAEDVANQRLKDLNPPDAHVTKGIDDAIEQLAKLDDKLREQAATYGLTGAAAVAYDLTLGKLSASVRALTGKSKEQIDTELKKLEDQGKISNGVLNDFDDAVARGIPKTQALTESILKAAEALDDFRAADSLSKMDQQILTLTGHFEDAAKAAFDLANRPLKITLQTDADKTQLAALDFDSKRAEVARQLNEIESESLGIQQKLKQSYADIAAAGEAQHKSAATIAGEEASARQQAIAQLNELFIRTQALANASGLKSASIDAEQLRNTLKEIQLNPQIIRDMDQLLQLMAELNTLTNEQKELDKEFAVQMSALDVQRSQGALNDIQLMNAQDDAINKQIEALTELREQFGLLALENIGDTKAQEQYDQLTVKINALKASTNQLARAIRDDFEQAASDAFVQFVNGTESASKAFHQFLADIETRLLRRAVDSLFQSIFGDLFSQLTSATGGALGGASSGAQAGLAISTAITTSGGIAATSMGTAITTAGISAGISMATAIRAASLASSATSALSEFGPGDLSALIPKAGGGPVSAGTPYLIGENGPEIMVPGSDGTIIPNGGWGRSVNVVNHFHIDAPRGTVSRATQAQIAALAAASLAGASARNN